MKTLKLLALGGGLLAAFMLGHDIGAHNTRKLAAETLLSMAKTEIIRASGDVWDGADYINGFRAACLEARERIAQ